MKNLKRILSLALASTMLIGMLVVGANAATFSDTEGNTHEDAIETMAALGVINGMGDGTFAPEGSLTRAQMVKMIATTFRGGNDDFDFAKKTNPTFSDVKATAWYAGVIEYAYNMKIIQGNGDGTCTPEAPLTTAQAARMILNAMGYTQGEGDWKLNTFLQAQEVGIFENLTDEEQMSEATLRDAACQMLADAITLPMVDKNGDPIASTSGGWKLTKGTDTTTDSKVQAIIDAGLVYETKAEAIMVGQGITLAGDGSPVGSGKAAFAVNFNVAQVGTGTVSMAQKYLSMEQELGFLESVKVITEAGANKGKYTLTTTAGSYVVDTNDCIELMGEYVQVLYKTDASKTVYGVLPVGKVIYEGTVGEYQDTVAAMTNTTVKGNLNGTTVTKWNTTGNFGALSAMTNYAYKLKVVDGGDAGVNMVALPYTMGTVSFKSATNITVAGAGISNAKLETVNGAADVAVGDTVVVISKDNTKDGKYEITKPETVSGTITKVGDSVKDIYIGGNWYSPATSTTTAAGTYADNRTLTLVNGYYVAAAANLAAATVSQDLVWVLEVGTTNTGLSGTAKKVAHIVGLDGTDKIVTYVEPTGQTLVGGELCIYTVKDDVYTLVAATTANTGYDGPISAASYTAPTASDPGMIGSTLIADDAVVVVAYETKSVAPNAATATTYGKDGASTPAALALKDTTKFKTISGAELKKWNAAYGVSADTKGFITEVNGIEYAKVIFLASGLGTLGTASAATAVNYGYVTAVNKPEYLGLTEGYIRTFKVWDGTQELELTQKAATNSFVSLAKGNVITFSDPDASNVVETVSTAIDMTEAAVIGFSAADKKVVALEKDNAIKASTNLTSVTDDTKILYVDTKTHVGAPSSGLPLATKDAFGVRAMNILFNADKGAANVIVVDTSNAVAGKGSIASKEDIKKLDDGVYETDVMYMPDIDGFNPNGKNVFFKFATTADKTNVTLTITRTIGGAPVEVYVETAQVATAGDVFFVINTVMVGPGNGDSKKNTDKTAIWNITSGGDYALKAGTYDVKVTAGSTELLTGSFSVK